MKKTNKDAVSYSERVREIVSSPPHIATEFGTYLVLFILVLLFIMAKFIKVKDDYFIPVTIVAENPPVPIVSPLSGVPNVIVDNGEIVSQNQVLAEVSPARSTAFQIDSIKLENKIALRSPINGVINFGLTSRGSSWISKDSTILFVFPSNNKYYGVFSIDPDKINYLKLNKKFRIALSGNDGKNSNYLDCEIESIPDMPINGRKYVIYLKLFPQSNKSVMIKHMSSGNLLLTGEPTSLLAKFLKKTFR